jgi:hypothetical protein
MACRVGPVLPCPVWTCRVLLVESRLIKSCRGLSSRILLVLSSPGRVAARPVESSWSRRVGSRLGTSGLVSSCHVPFAFKPVVSWPAGRLALLLLSLFSVEHRVWLWQAVLFRACHVRHGDASARRSLMPASSRIPTQDRARSPVLGTAPSELGVAPFQLAAQLAPLRFRFEALASRCIPVDWQGRLDRERIQGRSTSWSMLYVRSALARCTHELARYGTCDRQLRYPKENHRAWDDRALPQLRLCARALRVALEFRAQAHSERGFQLASSVSLLSSPWSLSPFWFRFVSRWVLAAGSRQVGSRPVTSSPVGLVWSRLVWSGPVSMVMSCRGRSSLVTLVESRQV